MKIKECIDKVTMKIGLAIAKRMSPVIEAAIDNPENLKFEGYIDGDEIVVKIKLKES